MWAWRRGEDIQWRTVTFQHQFRLKQKKPMSQNGLLISKVLPPQQSLLPGTGNSTFPRISYTLALETRLRNKNKTFQFNCKVPSKGSVLQHKAVAEVSTKAWRVESNRLSQTTSLTGRQIVGASMFDYTSSWQARGPPSYLFICPVNLPDHSTYSSQW